MLWTSCTERMEKQVDEVKLDIKVSNNNERKENIGG